MLFHYVFNILKTIHVGLLIADAQSQAYVYCGGNVRKITSSRWVSLGLVSGMFLLVGCQANLVSKPTDFDNSQFMSLWDTYSTCRTASDLREASSGMHRLSEAAVVKLNGEGPDGFVLPLPSQLERLVSSPPSRLAVDLHAMTAACSIHTGELALHAGSVDLAHDAFSSVLKLGDDLSPYYIRQAKKFLAELEHGVAVSSNTR